MLAIEENRKPIKMPSEEEKAGNGPSWRHIEGSKIAKGLHTAKVFSSTVLYLVHSGSLTFTEFRSINCLHIVAS